MTAFVSGEPIQVAGTRVKVVRVLAPNPGPMTGPGTNTYLVGDRELALVDPGPADQAHFEAIVSAIGDRQLRWILVTHTHADHSPGAAALARSTGAQLVGLPAPVPGHNDLTFKPARLFSHGEVLKGAEFSVELIHTPGHVSNHICYLLCEEALLFTGDHILQGTTSVILPPDGSMADYLESLRYLATRRLDFLAPGHGGIIPDAHETISQLIAHRLRREEKILSALSSSEERDAQALTLRVYDDIPANLLPMARLTLEAHLIKLQGEGRAAQSPAGWRLGR